MYKAVQLFSPQVTEQINLNRIVQDISILTREKYDLACPKKWAINHFFSGIWTQKKIIFSTFAAQTHVDYERVILSSKE